ncbi:MAG: hypothetical protein Q4F29_02535 [Lachnospiraceae bacterium]|nr:hypothetical protein [Lachnospiraceae bacterium]
MEKIWKNFLKCGTAGWCLEILFTSVESILTQDWRLMGKTSLLMFPIYGLGALLWPIGQMTDRWLRTGAERLSGIRQAARRDLVLRHGMMDMVLIFSAEYLFGFWLRRLGICPWDYSGRPTNVNGLIRLDFAPLWFFTGLLFEAIAGGAETSGRKLEKQDRQGCN